MVIGEVALSVVANLATDAGKKIYSSSRSWLSEALGTHSPVVEAKLNENGSAFMVALDERFQRLETKSTDPEFRAALLDAIEDPDVAVAVRLALLTAARSGSEARHKILAGIVAERLTLKSDTAKAAASNLAVSAVTNLGSEHLQVLGLLALIHAARPRSDEAPVRDRTAPAEEEKKRYSAAVEERGARFVAWMQECLEAHGIPDEQSGSTISHLVAASCLIQEPEVARRLRDTLVPPEYARGARALYPYGLVLEQFIHDDKQGFLLHQYWKKELQFLTPTPAGLLIGLAVHDARTGEDQVSRWEWSVDQGIVRPIRPDLSKLLDKKFERAVWEAVEREARSQKSRGGVLPWEY